MKNHFPVEETECHCGCGINNPSPILMERLNIARHIIEQAIYASNVCRCPRHNTDPLTGGSKTSSHITSETELGEAADIICQDSAYRFILVGALLKAGFKRILIYPTFIHVDVDEKKTQRILVYMKNK